MDENKLNNFSKKLFDNYELERPPKDFTEKLMLRIETSKSTQEVKNTFFAKNKFMIIFLLTFTIISLLSYAAGGGQNEAGKVSQIIEKYQLPDFNLSVINKYLDIDFEFSFIAKLIAGSIVLLLLAEFASSSIIDRFIDSKTRQEKLLKN